jgi:hypothetical protein
MIYGNEFGAGWVNNSSGVTLVETEGHLDVSYDVPLGDMRFDSEGFDTTGYNTLSFFIKPTKEYELLYVHLHDAQGNALWSYHLYVPWRGFGETLHPDVWQEIHIPLTELGANDSVVTGITFKHDLATEISLDEIRFALFTEDTGGCNEN